MPSFVPLPKILSGNKNSFKGNGKDFKDTFKSSNCCYLPFIKHRWGILCRSVGHFLCIFTKLKHFLCCKQLVSTIYILLFLQNPQQLWKFSTVLENNFLGKKKNHLLFNDIKDALPPSQCQLLLTTSKAQFLLLFLLFFCFIILSWNTIFEIATHSKHRPATCNATKSK